MLSINIPVYNVDVGRLVKEVARQAIEAGIDYEIRIYDDGSEERFRQKNRALSELEGIIYYDLPENLGRSAIRNRMGLDSAGDYLLFIDADSSVPSNDYLKKYIDAAYPGCVVCGGTAYVEEKPRNPEKLLRWEYGSAREAISAGKRNNNKGFIITSNNFLIDRQVFQLIHFRENIGPYGHEDTLMGYDLFRNSYLPIHIDNPVVHEGLEDSVTFLSKTRQALMSLLHIEQEVVSDGPLFSTKVRFLKQYNRLSQIIPAALLRLFFRLFHRLLEKNLTGDKPSLVLFDLYKVAYFAVLKSRKKDFTE